MAWYDEAIFYHIYPLGLCDAPKENTYAAVVHRLNEALPWIAHIKKIGCNAIYIGPLFESVGHGYETTDYKKLDSRLGDNADLTNFVKECHAQDIKVIFDGVFNHVGRDFFAFKDLLANREGSPYRDWFCNVNFGGNNEYNDGFCYDNWGGYNLLVKLNQHHPDVKNYICDVIRFWVSEFDVDGIRLDAADVLDFDYMHMLRAVANEVKPDFWLMGEVIHGDYSRWVNGDTLHAVTNYALHKALYSGHNDHNYFEIAHTIRREFDENGGIYRGRKLYSFVDNHDVDRIMSKLNNKSHIISVYTLLYTLPGIPSIYYGSEFGVEGRKEGPNDDPMRPRLLVSECIKNNQHPELTEYIRTLGKLKKDNEVLVEGRYRELLLTTRQYAFARILGERAVIVAVNNDEAPAHMEIPLPVGAAVVTDFLSGEERTVENGKIHTEVQPGGAAIYVV